MTNLSLELNNMSCASCVGRVERVLRAQPGVGAAQVNLATNTATLEYDAPATADMLVKAVADAGYPARETSTEIAVEGMSCASCVGKVERVLAAQPGVLSASANLARNSATIRYLAGAVTPADLAAKVTAAGYKASAALGSSDERQEQHEATQKALLRDTLLAAALTLPVFVAEMGGHLWPAIHVAINNSIGMQGSWLVQFVLITVVLAFPARRIFAHGVPALLRGAPDMNSLVVVGTSAAWLYSTLVTFAPLLLPADSRVVYFEAAGVIIALILLGRLLEHRAKGRTGQAIRKLMALRPKTALRMENGEAVEVPLEAIALDDLLLVKPGAAIPTDGVVVEGRSAVDESMISGEPMPVDKVAGDHLVGGSINAQGALTMRSTAIGSDTVLSQIVHLVEQAQASKLPVQALVDRIAGVFVPVVMVISALTLAVWLLAGAPIGAGVAAAVTVLIIACPCAMGLATPTSIMVGTGRGASMGVLFARGAAMQSLRNTTHIALDKTGTLTEGRPAFEDFLLADGFDADLVLAKVAAVESRSEHPIAQAIVAEAQARGLKLPEVGEFEAITGFGVTARVGGDDITIGADRLLARQNVAMDALAGQAGALAKAGKTPLYVALNGRLAAVITVADQIKPSTPKAIAAMHGLGLKVVMLTGDNAATAAHVAAELGIDDFRAEVLPQDKVAALRSLQDEGAVVAFVGDGINDAPALAGADTGIAIGTGTDVAIESADIVLMSGDLGGVVQAIALSRAVMRNIIQNLVWAFGYNVLLIPVAAGLLYPWFGLLLSPALAAGAMALSSVFVLGNALRLQKFKTKEVV
ncbi:heavy metal translocating P-type ATPase [Abyssibius alkaniclasticus]|uniref:heavy metal translocating P-type ATPase n=1 Tax=Abyssibius alkaniclasticus TaxID=2881234 RepID=UPI0023635350|nr:heavy metal translocating P-type ATPase [Abyssibius alkaniclasticus]UPH69823.1 heavy metal translocating P-type ATPase [Abyssibius alkaniclasticus]